jgi:large subunit ribosomal protein L1
MDVEKAVSEAKGGKVDYRVDKFSNLHIIAGKLSFDENQLRDNILAIISAILRERPAALKGMFIKSISLTSTMGPSIKLHIPSVRLLARK